MKLHMLASYLIGCSTSVRPSIPLYHYTTGEGLISIISSGELWSTHIACLNDAKELTLALDTFHSLVRTQLEAQRKANNPVPDDVEFLLAEIDRRMASVQPQTEGMFVVCFSEDNDDLSQWRAYAGHEGGYAIEFDAAALRGDGSDWTFLLKVEYEPEKQHTFIADVLHWTKVFFLDGLQKQRAPSCDEWIAEFLECWTNHVRPFVPYIKHKSFQAEREWRLVHHFRDADIPIMRYRQRPSMMTRHVPLKRGVRLPITGIRVGPTRHKDLSKVAVGDLLLTNGYDVSKISITETTIPFRCP